MGLAAAGEGAWTRTASQICTSIATVNSRTHAVGSRTTCTHIAGTPLYQHLLLAALLIALLARPVLPRLDPRVRLRIRRQFHQRLRARLAGRRADGLRLTLHRADRRTPTAPNRSPLSRRTLTKRLAQPSETRGRPFARRRSRALSVGPKGCTVVSDETLTPDQRLALAQSRAAVAQAREDGLADDERRRSPDRRTGSERRQQQASPISQERRGGTDRRRGPRRLNDIRIGQAH